MIPIDSIFSPVRRVAYSVEQARVGQRTDFDKLTLDIETDGSIDPQAALREAAEILISSLSIFTDEDRIEDLRQPPGLQLDNGAGGGAHALQAGGQRGGGPMDDILIEELELGVRSYNCLKRAGIQTVGDLVSKSEGELAAIPNFGKKSIDEVIETLSQRGLRCEPTDAPSEDPPQAQPRQRAPEGAAGQPLRRGHRPRADQDHRGQGQGRQAGAREADHAGAQG